MTVKCIPISKVEMVVIGKKKRKERK